MAEAFLYDLAKTVLSQLSSLALDELNLLWGHKEQLDKLENTITTIRNVLQDADRRQTNDASVQGWLARLKHALYEADDLFDTISAKILHQKSDSKAKFLSKPYDFAFLVKTAHKVKAIRLRLDEIAKDITQFNFLSNRVDQIEFERERTHSYIPSNEVEGREQERGDLVKMLLSDKRGVSVVALIGIGGLGKTTLAQVVYNDSRVQQRFDVCIWACINYFKNLDKVLVELVKSKELGLDQLQSCFREKIQGKRFLLVLDDVWGDDPQNWHKLRILLDFGKDGSMVLVTTRSMNVVQSLNAIEHYDLKPLSDQSAWLLFKKTAFAEQNEFLADDLEKLGRQIVKKCANVPLTIVTIANLLRYKEKRKWLPLVNDELSHVVPNEYGKIMQVLKISYNELPYSVKCCFAYCSLFPKGYEFEKDKLIQLWIAQGFVENCDDVSQSLEDRAEDYFFCLVERCFFQDMGMSRIKGVKRYTWKMNNLVLDLAKEVAKSECLLVDQIARSSWDKTLRHMSFVGHVCSFFHSKNLRTFLCLCQCSMDKEDLSKLISGFKAMRVLDLSEMGIKEIPTSVGNLIHLRFLDLSKNDMKTLPSSICNLHHLQSLILQGCENLMELPENLEYLFSLRQFVIQDCNELSHIPAGLAGLTSLVILKIESCGKCAELPSLSHLPSLKELYILNMSSMVTIEDNKFHKADVFFPSLETLWIWNIPNLTSWWSEAPTELPTFPCVTKLNIRNCRKLTTNMPLFPFVEHLKLESVQKDLIWQGIRKNNLLKRLRVSKISGLRKITEQQTRNLSSLQKLSVFRCEQLESVSCKAHEKLKITACDKLKWVDIDLPRIKYLEIPIPNSEILKGFRSLKSLENLKMYCLNQELHFTEEIQHLASLQQLSLTSCKELHLSWRALLSLNRLQIITFSNVEIVIDVDSEMVMTELSNLRELRIYGGSADWIHDIPWKLLKSLQYLHFSGIHNLKDLPEGIQDVSGLQRLKIMVCKSVVSLPCWMRCLTSLRYLEIRGSCRELKKRCEELRGKDWANIQHIQERNIT